MKILFLKKSALAPLFNLSFINKMLHNELGRY